MTEQIIAIIILVILAWARSEWNTHKIRRNELEGVIKRNEFERFEEKIDGKFEDIQKDFRDYKEKRAEEGKKIFAIISGIQAQIKNLNAGIDELEKRFNKYVNEK